MLLLVITLAIYPASEAFSVQNNKMTEKRLKACPDSPNCISSQAVRGSQFIEPIKYQGSAERAMAELLKIIQTLPRTRIVEHSDGYIRAEFQTKWLRFTDDVELLLDRTNKTVQLRSASRVGYSDFGTNLKRLDMIKNLYKQKSNQADG